MNVFVSEIITPPAHLPVTVAAADQALAAAVVEEIERGVLWRAIVRQERRILIDGFLPSQLELEPTTSIVSLTRWTPGNAAAVIDADSYSRSDQSRPRRDRHCARARLSHGPRPCVSSGASRLPTWRAGRSRRKPRSMLVTRLTNVPASVRLDDRAGNRVSGWKWTRRDITIGTLKQSASQIAIRRTPTKHRPSWASPRHHRRPNRPRSYCGVYCPGHDLGSSPNDARRRANRSDCRAKRRLLEGGVLQPVEWGVIVPQDPPDPVGAKSTRIRTWTR